MKPEITYLVWVTILTALMWIPYVLDRMTTWGLTDTVGYPEAPKLQSPWARRMKSAHANAVENLVIFATLVLAANALGVSNLVHGPGDRGGASSGSPYRSARRLARRMAGLASAPSV